jgi:hypothetical protein
MMRQIDIRKTVQEHVALWNAHDEDAWLAHWREAVPGDITRENPVGTAARGREDLAATWAEFNAGCELAIEVLVVNGDDAVALVQNRIATDAGPFVAPSIELYRFAPSDSLHCRFFFDAPNAQRGGRVEEIHDVLVRAHELWNAHDKDAWVALWRSAVSDDCLLDDHATGEVHRGFDECRPDTWERFNASVSFDRRALIVCGDEAAMVVDNVVQIGDDTVVSTSIETYRFGADGSLYEQNWYEVPQP